MCNQKSKLKDDDLHYSHLYKVDILSLTKFGEKVRNMNKSTLYIEVPLHKMGDVTQFLDDVTCFSPT